jgi:3-isopropylmalate/(R)-2-methylmalate dehydratase large subunit
MGHTIAEKILSRQNLQSAPASAGDIIDARLDGLMVHSQHWSSIRSLYRRLGWDDSPPRIWDVDKFYLMLEHVQPPRNVEGHKSNYDARREAARLGLTHFYDTEMGICHQMMVDYGHIRPGEFVVGTDSHTLMYGGINCVSTGIATDEAAYALAFGELFFSVPESIKVNLHGKARPYPFGKDIILYLAGQFGNSFAQNRSVEFHGPAAADLPIADRLTLADHIDEVGGKFGLFLADEKTTAFVRELTDQPFEPVAPDPDAKYIQEIDVDIDALSFQVAKPYRFDNVSPVGEVAGTKIDEARIGSCANGRFEDIEAAARVLEGKKVAPGVRCYVSPASMEVYRRCAREGILATLLDAGVQVQEPGCSICVDILINEEVCISSTTRNSHGRFGGADCADAQIYLAGPVTVAAAAIAGEIVDPREVLNV